MTSSLSRFPRSAIRFPECVECGAIWARRHTGGRHLWIYCPRVECQRAFHRDRFARFRIRYEQTHGVAYVMPAKLRSKHQDKRRARMARGESVRPRTVFERDGWACGICDEAIEPELAYPHPRSASVDHIVPLSLDGEHSYANVRAAHLDCNVRRGNRAGVDAAIG